MKREAYRSVDVKQVSIESLVADKPALPAVVGIDVAKSELLAVTRWQSGDFERPWRVKTPEEIPVVVDRLRDLAQGRPLLIAMESTGTYGDALRQALTDAGLVVHRVSGKAVHDYAEIFDGVPSQHDGKDAAIVAELAALGKSSPWPYQPPTEFDQELALLGRTAGRASADRDAVAGPTGGACWRGTGRRRRSTWNSTPKRCCKSWSSTAVRRRWRPTPARAKRLKRWGGAIPQEREDRAASCRLRPGASGCGKRRSIAVGCRSMPRPRCRPNMRCRRPRRPWRTWPKATRSSPVRRRSWVGATACVLWVYLGDPRNYHCAEAYRKAMGLNLKERSSGRHQGQLKITKRGPGAVRRWLYFAAMRLVQKAEVADWYEVKKGQRARAARGHW